MAMVMSMPGLLPRLMSGSMSLLWSVLTIMVPDTTEGLENRTAQSWLCPSLTATLGGVGSITCLDSMTELTLLWGGWGDEESGDWGGGQAGPEDVNVEEWVSPPCLPCGGIGEERFPKSTAT